METSRQETSRLVMYHPMKYEVKSALSQDQAPPILQRSVSNGHLAQTATPFRFLDLPLESRLEIYSYFARGVKLREWNAAEKQIAEAHSGCRQNSRNREEFIGDTRAADVRWGDFRAERRAIRTTRRGLTLVCHQVSNEFVPISYRHSTIIVHAPQSPVPNPYHTVNGELPANVIREPDTDSRKLTGPKDIITRGTASIFEKDFLSTTSFIRLSSIRYLSYDVSIWNRYLRHPSLFDFHSRFCRCCAEHNNTTNIDNDGLAEFPSILASCGDRLPSLEQVTVFLEGDGDLPRYQLTKEQARQPEEVWRVANEDGNWEQLEKILTEGTSRQTSVALRGWRVTRTVDVFRKGWPLMLVQHLQNKRYIKRVTIDFRKPQGEAAKNGQQEATAALLVHLDGSDDDF